jgi:hypothetical protein
MKNHINKEQWISMFKDIGLNEAAMQQWHRQFENRHPEAHQSFLEWLKIEPKELNQIRQNSR